MRITIFKDNLHRKTCILDDIRLYNVIQAFLNKPKISMLFENNMILPMYKNATWFMKCLRYKLAIFALYDTVG